MHHYLVTFDYEVASNNEPIAVELRSHLEELPNTKWFQHLPTEIILISSLSIDEIYKMIDYPENTLRVSISELVNFKTNSSRTAHWLSLNND